VAFLAEFFIYFNVAFQNHSPCQVVFSAAASKYPPAQPPVAGWINFLPAKHSLQATHEKELFAGNLRPLGVKYIQPGLKNLSAGMIINSGGEYLAYYENKVKYFSNMIIF